MKYCKRCLYSEGHPLGIIIDKDGICSGCRVHEEKDNLDWEYRLQKLKKIVRDYKCNKKDVYDCTLQPVIHWEARKDTLAEVIKRTPVSNRNFNKELING